MDFTREIREEHPVGPWKLTVYDRTNATNTGTFVDWKLGLHGAIEGGRAQVPPPPPPTSPPAEKPAPANPPPAQPTTSAAIPASTALPEEGNDSRVMVHISPFIYVMFAGMFVAIGAALFLMHRQRTNPRNVFGSALEDEEAGQRGGLLGRRGDYEFDELPTHELGGSDDEDEDDDNVDPDSRRIVFDRSNLVDSDHEEDSSSGMKETKSPSNVRDTISSPLSSGEEIERESSFEVAEREEEEGDEDEDEDEDDDFGDHPGGTGKKVKGDWDEFSSLVKTKDGKYRR
jgi:kexin